MLVAAQKDSLLKSIKTTVHAVTALKAKGQWHVELKDTVLFPEGGGQPADHGRLRVGDGAWTTVRDVQRRADGQVLHTVESASAPCCEGDAVEVEVDWNRRWDHMQQHSAQHLISALADTMYGESGKTVSWALGAEVCTIEFEKHPCSAEELQELQDRANEAIREARSVTVHELSPEELEEASSRFGTPFRSRGIAARGVQTVRVVEIAGVDVNSCCGTHVKNLAQLQSIVLTGFETVRRGHPVAVFVAGDRVSRRLACSLARERELTGLLNAGPASHAELVRKMAAESTELKRAQRQLWKELVPRLAAEAASQAPQPHPADAPLFVELHVELCDGATMQQLARSCLDEALKRHPAGALVFVTTAEPHWTFVLMSDGPNEQAQSAAARLGDAASRALGGKGGGKKHYQGKYSSSKGRAEAVENLQKELYAAK